MIARRALKQIARGHAAAGERRDEADRLAVMQRERLELVRPESAREERVVAERRMRVERQVIRGEREVGLEQDLQPALQLGVDRAEVRSPEDAVMHEQQLRALGRRELEQLEVRRDAGRDGLDLDRAGHLQTVRPVVVEARRLEQAVELGDDLAGEDGHRATIRQSAHASAQRATARPYGILTAHRGVAQPGSAHRSGR